MANAEGDEFGVGNVLMGLVAYLEADFLDDDDDDDNKWEKVTVNINEYLVMQDPSFRHFRLSKPLFETLCEELGNYLVAEEIIIRERTPLSHILMMVLWILATPDSFRSVALRFGVYPSVVHLHYVCIIGALRGLGARYITWPNAEERLQIKNRLQRISSFPGIVALIDGKHFKITRPIDEPAAYRNRHHDYSILAQAVCDDRLLIRDLYIGEAGSLHDARVFRRSPLLRNILNEDHLFSEGEHIVGDSAYPLMNTLITPFRNNGHLTHRQRNYNYLLSRCRVRIEHAFGRATSLWRRLKFLHVRNLEYGVDHIAASFVLHSFKIMHGEEFPIGDVEDEDIDIDGPRVDPRDDRWADGYDDEEMDNGDADDDPHVPHGEAAQRLRDAMIVGEQKRWDICNELDMVLVQND